MNQKALTRHRICQCLNLGFSSLQNCEKSSSAVEKLSSLWHFAMTAQMAYNTITHMAYSLTSLRGLLWPYNIYIYLLGCLLSVSPYWTIRLGVLFYIKANSQCLKSNRHQIHLCCLNKKKRLVHRARSPLSVAYLLCSGPSCLASHQMVLAWKLHMKDLGQVAFVSTKFLVPESHLTKLRFNVKKKTCSIQFLCLDRKKFLLHSFQFQYSCIKKHRLKIIIFFSDSTLTKNLLDYPCFFIFSSLPRKSSALDVHTA